ncbi:leucyl/phenylalanyl-tRNA--protein transferase [Ornithobacterium rhinotracheale]|uniref:leucyl/phenylalanyl-tRNA--protein transferase n=1 Tax=Ornithobacterium rhinotracheale TaxID=28251 RepID=UPI00387327EF
MLFLEDNQPFPPAEMADRRGILAFSMSLKLPRLIAAYHQGIFPWYNEGEPVIWWCPDPRMVLFPEELKVSKSMKKVFREEEFTFTINKDFVSVIKNCQKIYRAGQDGTWITQGIIENYVKMHKLGLAHSVEVWNHAQELVGGLYGVKINRVFCGESMFAKESNASKAGFIWFVQKMKDHLALIDCQVYTKHLASLGARLIPRKEFLKYLD